MVRNMIDRTLRSKKTVAEIGEKLAEWSKTWGEYTVIKASRFKALCQELVEPEDVQNTENSLWFHEGTLSFSVTINGECISGYIERKAYQDGKSVAAVRLSGGYVSQNYEEVLAGQVLGQKQTDEQADMDRKKQIARKFFEQFFGENIVVEHRRKKIPYPEIGEILKLQQTVLNPSS